MLPSPVLFYARKGEKKKFVKLGKGTRGDTVPESQGGASALWGGLCKDLKKKLSAADSTSIRIAKTKRSRPFPSAPCSARTRVGLQPEGGLQVSRRKILRRFLVVHGGDG